MDIKREHVIILVIILALIWIYLRWGKSEHFLTIPPRQWEQTEPKEWKPNWYYKNEELVYPAVPSIVSYDNSTYTFPSGSMKLLDDEYAKSEQIQPIPENTPSLIHINQAGASLAELNQTGPEIQEQTNSVKLPPIIPSTSTSPMAYEKAVYPKVKAYDYDENPEDREAHEAAPFRELVEKDISKPEVMNSITPQKTEHMSGQELYDALLSVNWNMIMSIAIVLLLLAVMYSRR